jgi:cell division protein FtsB
MRKKARYKLFDLVIKYKKWLWVALALFFVYSFVAGNTGFYTHIKLLIKGQELKNEIKQAKQENKILEEKIDSLKNDKEAMREVSYKNGLAADDEIIIVIDEDMKKK